jgi:poly(A) polymerase
VRYRYSAGKDGELVKKAVIYTCDEHGINFADVDKDAVSIVKKLKEAGFETYIVGGAVRDLVLGKKPKDFDIVSEASPARIKKIFRNARIIGRRFRLVHVYSGMRIFEVSTFRSLRDGLTSNTFGTIEEDVFRRDFSLNALFYDPSQQIVVDYVGGMKDIEKKLIKPVIPLDEIFTDDPVRMIRAIKYAAAAGFTVPINMKWKIKKQSPLISSISNSRLTEEIFKIIHSSQAAEIVDALDKAGLYSYLQPQAAKLMRENPDFRQRYMRSMAANQKVQESRSADVLGALFFDHLEDIANWKNGIVENYRIFIKAARSFIFPMAPPRHDLDRAIRKFFASHGITVKKLHLAEPPKPVKAEPEAASGEPRPPTKKRKRRRKPSKARQAATT